MTGPNSISNRSSEADLAAAAEVFDQVVGAGGQTDEVLHGNHPDCRVFVRESDLGRYYLRVPADRWSHSASVEARLLAAASQAAVPVPETIWIGAVGDRGQRGMVQRAVRGSSLDRVSGAARSVAIPNLAQCLKRLHEEVRHPTRLGDTRAFYETLASSPDQLQLRLAGIGMSLSPESAKVFHREASLLVQARRSLCHGDLRAEHVYVDDCQHVTAIIDFGQSLVAISILDYVTWSHCETLTEAEALMTHAAEGWSSVQLCVARISSFLGLAELNAGETGPGSFVATVIESLVWLENATLCQSVRGGEV